MLTLNNFTEFMIILISLKYKCLIGNLSFAILKNMKKHQKKQDSKNIL